MSSEPKHPTCSPTLCGFAGGVGVEVGVGGTGIGLGVDAGRVRVNQFDQSPIGLFIEAIARTRYW